MDDGGDPITASFQVIGHPEVEFNEDPAGPARGVFQCFPLVFFVFLTVLFIDEIGIMMENSRESSGSRP